MVLLLNLKGPCLFLRIGVLPTLLTLRRCIRAVSVDTPALVQSFSNLACTMVTRRLPKAQVAGPYPAGRGGVQEFAFPLNSQVVLLQDPLEKPVLVLAASPDAERPDGSLTL